jgi:hypothetical protein
MASGVSLGLSFKVTFHSFSRKEGKNAAFISRIEKFE